jgi:hypothetical protein
VRERLSFHIDNSNFSENELNHLKSKIPEIMESCKRGFAQYFVEDK